MATKRDSRRHAACEYEKRAAGLRRERRWFWALSLAALIAMLVCNVGAASVRKYRTIEDVHGWDDLLGNAASPAALFTLIVGVIPPVIWVLAAVSQSFGADAEDTPNGFRRYAPYVVVLGAFAVAAWCTFQFITFVGLPVPLAAAFPLFIEVGCAWSTVEITARNARLKALETDRAAVETLRDGGTAPVTKPPVKVDAPAAKPPVKPSLSAEPPAAKVPTVTSAVKPEAPAVTGDAPAWIAVAADAMERDRVVRGKRAADYIPIITAISGGYTDNRMRDEGIVASQGTAAKVRAALEDTPALAAV